LMVHQQKVVIKNLPDELAGLRIVQISDLHGKRSLQNKLPEKVNGLKPDILVITGDIIDNYHIDYSYIEQLAGPMRAKYGKFFVSGNNEYSTQLSWDEMEKTFRSSGVKVLHNSNYRIKISGGNLWLVGVDDPNRGRARLSEALKGTDGAPKILLAHSPEIIDEARAAKIDIVLAGHTHGGQIRIPGLDQRPGLRNRFDEILEKLNYWVNRGANFIWRHRDRINEVNLPGMRIEETDKSQFKGAGEVFTYNIKPGYEKYIAGLYRAGDTQMYVNRGLGETRIPFRLFSPPEITEFQLVRE